MTIKSHLFAGVLAVLILISINPASLQSTEQKSGLSQSTDEIANPESQKALTLENYSRMPLAFTKNEGQWDDQALFKTSAGGARMWFTNQGLRYQFIRHIPRLSVGAQGFAPWAYDRDCGRQMSSSAPAVGLANRGRFDHEPDSIEQLVVEVSFVGANPNPRVVGEEMMEYKCNYFLGNDPSVWRTDVPNYRAVRFEEIYPGIDLKYYGNCRQMEYDFIVSPGADYSQIRIQYDGCNSLSVNESGELVVETEWGSVIEQRPVVYQLDGDRRIPLQGDYVVSADHSFGFALGDSYNPNLPLVIDPVLELVYSTYLGGYSTDVALAIAINGNGNAYVTGNTWSSDFPTQYPYQTDQPDWDVFVIKLNSAGNGLIYSTHLGGNSSEQGHAIAVDLSGNAYVTGTTVSSDFPTQDPYQTGQLGPDAFVTKLNAAGNGLAYGTYLGGSGKDFGMAITVDGSGNAYVAGFTSSSDFPTQNPYQAENAGGDYDVFVTKLSSTGQGLAYSTYLGGEEEDECHAIAVDGSGNAYVAGFTSSSNFPTQNPYQTNQLGIDAFVTKLNAAGNGLVYSTFLGGEEGDYGYAIAVDDRGNAYVTGLTSSSDFPTQNPYQADQPNHEPYAAQDIFVTKINSSGDGLVYSTYLGGWLYDYGYAIAVDGSATAYVAGYTSSPNFPTQNPYQTDQRDIDAFVAKLHFDIENSI